MEKPQPVPGQIPDFQPPPYSSSLGSQYQVYTPVPPLPTNSPYPMRISTSQNAEVCNPTSQVTTNDGRPLPQLGFKSTYASTIYDPMANLPPVNLESTPNQTVIVSAQSADSPRKATRCRYLKILSTIGSILFVLGVVLRGVTRTQRYKNAEVKVPVKDMHQEYTDHNWQVDYDALQREFVSRVIHQNDPNWQYSNRYRRMVDAQEIGNFRDYDFIDFNDQPLFDKLFKPEKSSRRRRDLEMKNKFDRNGIRLSTKKKKYYKAKKFVK